MRRALVVLALAVLTGCAAPPRQPARSLAAGWQVSAPSRAQSPQSGPPLVVLVSFDGWRWDYHTKAPVPNLQRLMARGVRAEGLIPSYPSKTAPNHYSIVTGLYPGHHGIVGNVIRDPASRRVFRLSDRTEVESPMWWGGEPIWNTAQRAGLLSASMFWMGSEAPVGGTLPRLWRRYDEAVPAGARVDQVLAWLALPPSERPSLVTLYLEDTDTMGHWYGPDSPQVRTAITQTDEQVGRLVAGLARLGLTDRANIVLVSDHGMAATSVQRTIFVDSYVSLSDVEIADINPTLGITPRPGTLDAVYKALSLAHPRLDMYKREDTPLHWYFRDQPRVPPITGVADEGWVVLRDRAQFADYWQHSPEGGQHGYDPGVLSMRGLFVAAGPAFKTGVTVPAFENVDVYNVLARVLGVEPAPNDGDPGVVPTLLK